MSYQINSGALEAALEKSNARKLANIIEIMQTKDNDGPSRDWWCKDKKDKDVK